MQVTKATTDDKAKSGIGAVFPFAFHHHNEITVYEFEPTDN
jgi:hypothetical protein